VPVDANERPDWSTPLQHRMPWSRIGSPDRVAQLEDERQQITTRDRGIGERSRAAPPGGSGSPPFG
jgi:hypothetical protein